MNRGGEERGEKKQKLGGHSQELRLETAPLARKAEARRAEALVGRKERLTESPCWEWRQLPCAVGAAAAPGAWLRQLVAGLDSWRIADAPLDRQPLSST